MANRFPLILDTADSNKLKELPNGDNLDLTGSGISAVGDITSTGSTTVKSVKLSGYTTAERDALTPVEGQMIYNTSTDTFQGYLGTAWQSFSSGLTTADLSIVTSTPAGGGALSYNSNSGVFTFSPADSAAQTLTLNGDNLQISGGNTLSLASLPLAYANITGKPTTIAGYGITNGQVTLVSGVNIKTINGNSLLGSGDIQIQGGGSGSDAPMNFSVGADDSTLRQINTGESIRFLGGTNITTTSDAEGNITIATTGIALTDLSVTSEGSASGDGSFSYNNSNGQFTYTPPTLNGLSNSGDVDFGANKILFANVYSSEGDLPSAATYHGMFAHVHGTGKAYYAHAGNWVRLGNYDEITSVGTGNVTFTGTTIDTDDSSGISITPTVTANSDLIVENNIRCSNVVFAESFQSTATGVPTLTSNSSITLSAVDRINVTRGPIKQASFTTVDRDALSSVNGDIIYNTTTNAFQGYANGSWADLNTAAGIGNVVEDTTPQLGGDLDVNGKTVKYQFNITNDNTDHYVFTDPGSIWFPSSENDPTLYLRRGEQYLFNNTSGGHPFRIQSTTGLSGTPYSTGVTNNGGTGQVIFKVPMSAPATLYYQCTSHTNMNGTINIV